MSAHKTAAPDAPQAGAAAELIEDWPLRPWLLAGLLGVAGLIVHALVGDYQHSDVPWRAGFAAATGFGALALAFTLNLKRAPEALAFGVLIALVLGLIAWHITRTDTQIAGVEYSFAAAVFFAGLALPLFQAGFHRQRWRTDYADTHFHVWTDAISAGGALAFVGLSWIMLFLLDSLFSLIGIKIIGELVREGWFGWSWSGAAFGAALGVIRNNLRIIGALQNVVMLVFALLAVPLALALVVFLLALLASGGAALWEATDSATPILLSCAAGSFVLFNAIIRDNDQARSNNKIMLIAAAVLAAGILPLTLFAAISTGLRIDQHGLSPERIWAVIAVAVASAYGIGSFVALARGRMAGWSAALRDANLKLAAGVCVLAFALALPFWDFGAISAKNQVARLDRGAVTPEAFDFTALRWDFGAAGEAALARLAQREGEVGLLAAAAKAQVNKPHRWAEAEVPVKFHTQPADPELERQLRAFFETDPYYCNSYCVALDRGRDARGRRIVLIVQRHRQQWLQVEPSGAVVAAIDRAVEGPDVPELGPASTIEIRDVAKPYVFIDGVETSEQLREPDLDVE